MGAPAEAICQETIWKNPELLSFAVSLITEAVKLHPANFTTDIIPDSIRKADSPGMAGSVVTMLQNASLIEPVGVVHGGKFYPERVPSTRPGAKSRYVNVYKLASVKLAEAFLAQHTDKRKDAENAETQTELLTTGYNYPR